MLRTRTLSLIALAILAILAVTLTAPAQAQSESSPEQLQEFVLGAMQDVSVTGFGTDPYEPVLRVGAISDSRAFTYIRFDLSGIPSGYQIAQARLEMRCADYSGETVGKLKLSQVGKAWDQKTIRFENRPTRIRRTETVDVGKCVGDEWKVFSNPTVLESTKDWYLGQRENYGFVLGPNDVDLQVMYVFYASDRQPVPPDGYGPRLIVSVEGIPTSTPTSTSMPTSTSTPVDTATPTPTSSPELTNTPRPVFLPQLFTHLFTH